VMFSIWGGNGLLAFLPFGELTATITADPDWRILAFTATVSVASGVAFGLAPAFQTTNPDLASTMKAQAGTVTSGGSEVYLRKGLVVAQMALSLLLLAGAGLFLRSMGNLRHIDLGFRPDHLMSFRIEPSLSGYRGLRAIAMMDTQVASLPGVRAVAMTQTPVLVGSSWKSAVTVAGYHSKEGEDAPNVDSVGPGYFVAMGMPLVAGRDLQISDDAAAPHVAVVNETFASYYYGGSNAVGRSFYFAGDASKTPVQIVGVAKDGKYADVKEEKQRFVFCPYAQRYIELLGGMSFFVRTAADPSLIAPALREAVHQMDANLPVTGLRTMEQQVDESLFAERIVSLLSAFFGVLATVLAAIGLYGVMSYAVTRRTPEIGVRLALGANPADVVRLILREVALLTAAGIAIAAPLYFPLAKLAKSLLFGVAPNDTKVLAGAAIVLALTALAAGCLPAARAARVDPLVALRNE
jgi:predicted permease